MREFIAHFFTVNSHVCFCLVLVDQEDKKSSTIPDESPGPITMSSLQQVFHMLNCPFATTIPQSEYKQLIISAGFGRVNFSKRIGLAWAIILDLNWKQY